MKVVGFKHWGLTLAIALGLSGCKFGVVSGLEEAPAPQNASGRESTAAISQALRPSKLTVEGAPSINKGLCAGPYKVWSRNQKNADAGVSEAVNVSLSANFTTLFYSDAACRTSITSVTIARQQSQAAFYVKAVLSGSLALTAEPLSRELGEALATGTASIQVANSAPTTPSRSVTTDEDTRVEMDLVGTDENGDNVSFQVGGAAPVRGTVQVSAQGHVIYQPNPNMNGSDAFFVTVCDGTDCSSPVRMGVTIRPVNDAPTLTQVGVVTGANEDTALEISYDRLSGLTNALDVDGDTLSFQVVDLLAGSLTVDGQVFHPGTPLNLRPGGRLLWTPAPNANGTINAFSIRAMDSGLLSASAVTVRVSVQAVNDAPRLTFVGTLTGGREDEAYTRTFDNLKAASDASDVDGDTLRFKVTGTYAGTLRINNLPYQMGSNDMLVSGSSFTWTGPTNMYGDIEAFKIVALDASLQSPTDVPVRINLASVNDAPVASAAEIRLKRVDGLTYLGQLPATDPDGDTLTYRIVTPPSGTFSATMSGSYTYRVVQSTGSPDPIVFEVRDSGGLTSTASISVVLENVLMGDSTFGSNGQVSSTGQILSLAAETNRYYALVHRNSGDSITAYQGNGNVDLTFGTLGSVGLSLGVGIELTSSRLLLANGFLWVVGSAIGSGPGANSDIFLAKVTRGGALVTAFADTGFARVDFSGAEDVGVSVVAAAEGMVVVGTSNGNRLGLAMVDTTSGLVLGQNSSAPSAGSLAAKVALYDSSRNRVLIGAAGPSHTVLVAFRSSTLLPDSTFGLVGYLSMSLDQTQDEPTGLFSQGSNGYVVVAKSNNYSLMARLNFSGETDLTFGGAPGLTTVRFGVAARTWISSIGGTASAIYLGGVADGKIVLMRYDASGRSDIPGAGVTSGRFTDYGAGADCHDLYIHADGRSVLAGHTSSGGFLLRSNP